MDVYSMKEILENVYEDQELFVTIMTDEGEPMYYRVSGIFDTMGKGLEIATEQMDYEKFRKDHEERLIFRMEYEESKL